ncbi:MAG TPA: hypothetical protein VGQ41_14905 [Pyrinomonadaceae bacterium]|jgi:hypothetical protein|nr:hypothetical protein [Pyrinomonadaceae bacterium]
MMKIALRWTNHHRWKTRLLIMSAVVVSVLAVVLLLALAQRQSRESGQQARPRRVSESASNPTQRVATGGDFQQALNSAKCGDTIILEAGAVYKPRGDSFVLPKKPACSGTDSDYITIQTSNLEGISAPGERIAPAKHAAAMPKLVGTSGNFVILAEKGAHHYKFIGIEITTSGNNYSPDLINLGSYFSREERLATNHFVFDRMFMHAPETTAANLFPTTVERTVGRGLAMGVADVTLSNSYLAGFCGKYPKGSSAAGQNIDSYGVYSDAGPGPYRIVNNYIEAQFNNVFIGGAGMGTTNTATISNATASSATFSNVANLAVGDLVAMSYSKCTPAVGPNVYARPWQTGRVTAINGNQVEFAVVKGQNSCEAGAPDNGGVARWKGDLIENVEIRQNTLNKPDVWNAFSNPKGWIEIKLVKNLVIDGNDMYSGVGTTLMLTVRNQDGSTPWGTIADVIVTNNRMRGYKWGFSLLMSDNEQPSMSANNILIRNNLFYEPRPAPNSAANFLQLVGGRNIRIEHNTIVQPGSPVVSDSPTPGFVFKDNIVASYQYGMQCTVAPNTPSTCWPGMVMKGNVIIDTRWDKGDGSISDRYPFGNFFVNSAEDIGFVDAANGNYQLAPTSKIRGRASDRTDPGVDVAALTAALNGK